MRYSSLDDLRAACRDIPLGDAVAAAAAAERQLTLTKPIGSLGRLEELAVWFARWRGRTAPELKRVSVLVFAGNHGVTNQGVSAYPQAVTKQMVANFGAGGAAINQISRLAAAELDVIPLDLDRPTADFTRAPAMDIDEFLAAIDAGHRAVRSDADLIAVGEMGIGNTTAAAALCAMILGGRAVDWVGRGTGIDDAGLRRKCAAVDAGLRRHASLGDPLKIAAAFGGRELAAIAGAVLAARMHRIPVLLDGFVATAAILPLVRVNGALLDHCRAAHVSAEAGHRQLLSRLGMPPLLDLEMRLGEASGAALAILLLRASLACHAGMATFADAGVSETGN